MKKCEIVKDNNEFDNIIQNGQSEKNNEFVIYYINKDNKNSRFGISVGKKIGNAVTRNYYKRIVRNICDKYKNLYSKGKDYIIIVRKGSKEADFSKIEESFVHLMKRINVKGNTNEQKD